MNEEKNLAFFGLVKIISLKLCKGYFFKIPTLIYKTLLTIFLGIIMSLFLGSCKTCKCPAYSHFELKTPVAEYLISI